MNRYTIYCTESQTKKALGLGAPIMTFGYGDLGNAEDEILKMNRQAVLSRKDDNSIIVGQIPTAEQMIGWLEDGKIRKVRLDSLSYEDHEEWFYSIFDVENSNITFKRNYPSRKEATLAAIDAALEYLVNNKLLK